MEGKGIVSERGRKGAGEEVGVGTGNCFVEAGSHLCGRHCGVSATNYSAQIDVDLFSRSLLTPKSAVYPSLCQLECYLLLCVADPRRTLKKSGLHQKGAKIGLRGPSI